MFYRKSIFKNFAILTGKQGLQLCLKETQTQVFTCKYCEIFRKTYFEEYLRTAASDQNLH